MKPRCRFSTRLHSFSEIFGISFERAVIQLSSRPKWGEGAPEWISGLKSCALRGFSASQSLLPLLPPFSRSPSPALAREAVSFRDDYMPGTIVIKHAASAGSIMWSAAARRSPIRSALGKAGKSRFGTRYIDGKRMRPAWSPPAESEARQPAAAECHSGRNAGQPDGRRGADLVGRRTRDPWHQRPGSIGGYVSSMAASAVNNADILDLFDRVSYGMRVVVTQ